MTAPDSARERIRFTTASHIRGQVTRSRNHPKQWWYTVVNEATGATVIRSDEFSQAAAMTSCAIAVTVARGAWYYELNHRELARTRPKELRLSGSDVQAVLTWALGSQPYGADKLMSRMVAVVGQ